MVSTPFIIVVTISLLNFPSGALCGWVDDVKDPPLSSMVSAGNDKIYLKDGKGCGHCFQIFCAQKPHCSGKPIKVTISNQCIGSPCYNTSAAVHFELSGFAFGKMAKPGQDQNLRKVGQVNVQYERVPCSYGNTKIAFKTSVHCNSIWFGMAIEYVNGDGVLASVEMATGGTHNYSAVKYVYGAVWEKSFTRTFKPPFSFRLTSPQGKTIVATNVIPLNFSPGKKYSSTVNF